MTDDILLIHTEERVRTLTLNRPQSRNALSAALRDQFFGALADAETDDDLQAGHAAHQRGIDDRQMRSRDDRLDFRRQTRKRGHCRSVLG